MRRFYRDEAPLDTLLQIERQPVWDGNLVSKSARDDFVKLGWVIKCEGWNVLSKLGREVCTALSLERTATEIAAAEQRGAAGEREAALTCVRRVRAGLRNGGAINACREIEACLIERGQP